MVDKKSISLVPKDAERVAKRTIEQLSQVAMEVEQRIQSLRALSQKKASEVSSEKGKVIKITVHLYSQSQPLVFENVRNTYQKGDLFCVNLGSVVQKFPLTHVFRIIEE